MPAYHAAFRSSELVRVADREKLLAFQREWAYHHPLQDEQLAFAGQTCYVRHVSHYHCGDTLYELGVWTRDAPPSRYWHEEAVPGFWHEPCLRDRDLSDWHIPLPKASEVYRVVPEVREGQPVVVVRTVDGLECLVTRHFDHERRAARMAEVAAMRDTLSFEWRYDFQGVAHAALRQRAEERITRPPPGGVI
jgi:hypothetical protein